MKLLEIMGVLSGVTGLVWTIKFLFVSPKPIEIYMATTAWILAFGFQILGKLSH